MKFILALPIIIVLFHFPAEGSSQSEEEKTLLWEIQDPESGNSSYLFGSIHIIPKKDFMKFERADSLLAQSEELVLEMDINVSMKIKMEWAKQMLLPEGSSIEDYMDSTDFQNVKSYALDSLGIKAFLFNTYLKMKPFAFYSAFIPHVIGKKIESYEMYFSDIAAKQDIPIFGLESFEYQMGIFDSIPYDQQLDMFFGEDLDMKTELVELLELYKSQDIYTMAGLLEEDESKYSELEEELLIRRNENWALILEPKLTQEQLFIVVGAAHLAGDHGLIPLLREKGFILRPIPL